VCIPSVPPAHHAWAAAHWQRDEPAAVGLGAGSARFADQQPRPSGGRSRLLLPLAFLLRVGRPLCPTPVRRGELFLSFRTSNALTALCLFFRTTFCVEVAHTELCVVVRRTTCTNFKHQHLTVRTTAHRKATSQGVGWFAKRRCMVTATRRGHATA
jgi:hypothetical protein